MTQTNSALLDAVDTAILTLVSGEAVTNVVVNGQTLQFRQESLPALWELKEKLETRVAGGGPRRSYGSIGRS